MAAAFAAQKGGDPLAMLASIRNSKGTNKLIARYVGRPEFMKLMTEVMNDPGMKPFMSGLPGGMPAGPGGGSGAPPGAALRDPYGARPRVLLPAAGDGGGEITLDTSVMGGPAAPAPAASKKRPPPVDNGQY